MSDLAQISENANFTPKAVETIIEESKENFKDTVTVQSVTDAVITLMSIVGRYSKVSGQDKKFVVTKVLIHIVNTTDIGGEADTILDTILINIIPILIDRLVSVENGKIVLNKRTKKVFKQCMPCLF